MKLLQRSALGPAPTWEGAYWILRMIRRAVSLSGRTGQTREEEMDEEEDRGDVRQMKDESTLTSFQSSRRGCTFPWRGRFWPQSRRHKPENKTWADVTTNSGNSCLSPRWGYMEEVYLPLVIWSRLQGDWAWQVVGNLESQQKTFVTYDVNLCAFTHKIKLLFRDCIQTTQ